MIRNIQELAHEVSAARDASVGATDEETAKSIARRLYKDTRCGISFWTDGATVVVSGYCEGVDVDCQNHELTFPFETEKFWEAVEEADKDGCEMWDMTHGCEKCGEEIDGHIPVNPGCKSCGGHGTVI